MPTSTTSKETALYDELIGRSRELSVLSSCSAVLGWDEQTYMPAGAAAHRGEQLALLAGLQHDQATAPRLGELLAALENSSIAADRDSIEAANIRQLQRDYDRRTKLPRGLVESLARTTSLAQQVWISARRNSDFACFRPWLEQVLELKRQESQCLHETLLKERRAARPAHPKDEPRPDALGQQRPPAFLEAADQVRHLAHGGRVLGRHGREASGIHRCIGAVEQFDESCHEIVDVDQGQRRPCVANLNRQAAGDVVSEGSHRRVVVR